MFCIFKGYTSDNFDGEINKTLHDFELDDIQSITAKNLSAGGIFHGRSSRAR